MIPTVSTRFGRSLARLGLVLAPVLSGGCAMDHQPADSGTATLRWAITEAKDPASCGRYHATSVNIDVYDSAGTYLDRNVSPCTAFGATLSLRPGYFGAALQLVDAQGQAVSTTLASSFLVQKSQNVLLDSDFAAMCFP